MRTFMFFVMVTVLGIATSAASAEVNTTELRRLATQLAAEYGVPEAAAEFERTWSTWHDRSVAAEERGHDLGLRFAENTKELVVGKFIARLAAARGAQLQAQMRGAPEGTPVPAEMASQVNAWAAVTMTALEMISAATAEFVVLRSEFIESEPACAVGDDQFNLQQCMTLLEEGIAVMVTANDVLEKVVDSMSSVALLGVKHMTY